MPMSAYATSLALDDDVVYLLTSNAAYRLVAGQPAQGIELELGVGAVLTRASFVFWSKGTIWSAPKQGGVTRPIANFPHRPQYFVTSGESVAWVDRSEEGLDTIQTLEGREPRVLVSSSAEISALHMMGDAIYFVQRPTERTWRIGVVRITGDGAPQYQAERGGRTPALLTGADDVYYYDVDKLEIRRLASDGHGEGVMLPNVVCSPIQAASEIYCGSVEGLFQVFKETHLPRVLSYGRTGFITNIRSNSKHVVWTVDVGPDALAVDMLPATLADGTTVPTP
jgi:hypothetical protein